MSEVASIPANAGLEPKGTPEERLLKRLSGNEEGSGTDEGAGDDPEGEAPLLEAMASEEDPVAVSDDGEIDELQSEGPDSTPDASDAEMWTAKVDGKEEKVSKEEALKAYSFKAHNTRTAQKLAEERKAFEATTAEANDLVTRYREVLPRLEQIALGKVARFADVDWATLRDEDPAEYAIQWADYERENQTVIAVTAERKAEEAKAAKEYEGKMLEYVEQEQALLLKAIPEWKDEKVRNTELDAIAKFALEQGFDQDFLRSLYDHRAYKVLKMAMKYQSLVSKAEGVKNGRKATTKTASPKASQKVAKGDAAQAARERLRSSGRSDDAASALLARMESRAT